MGNKVMSHPRIVLTGTLMSHFKASDLIRDVHPIINEWQKNGAELCLGREEFQRTFDVVIDSDAHFACFDTDNNGKVDAYEVLVVYILLSTGEKTKKLETAFAVFSFLNGTNPNLSISFDEAMIMLSCCVRGVSKVCLDAIQIQDAEVLFLCQSMFDMHRLSYGKRIVMKQFIDWACGDPSPSSFINLFHTAIELSDIRSEVQRRNLEQAAIFQNIAAGKLEVPAEAVTWDAEFQKSLEDPTKDELEALIELMVGDNIHECISSDRYHAVLRPWNIFNECDLDGSHALDEKELDILLWFQLRQRQNQDFVRKFMDLLDANRDGAVSRLEWVQMVCRAKDIEVDESLLSAVERRHTRTMRELVKFG